MAIDPHPPRRPQAAGKPARHPFDGDLVLEEPQPRRFLAPVSDNWSINGTPNGGYLLALLARAMQPHTDMQATPILTAHYLARCLPGPVEVHVEPVARSARFTRLQARLYQDGQEKTRAMGTFAAPPDDCRVERYERQAPALPPPEACRPIPELPRYTLYRHVEVRLDPEGAGWMEGKPAARSEHRGWIRFREPRATDVGALALMADAFPPAVLASQGLVAWVPTLELSLSIRRVPEARWICGRFRTRYITCGLLEEDGELWDPQGRLVAISRQIAQYRMA
jgi:acyl-CoA thioesterase